jgi:peptidoglycan-N-acetylglucosamine deacetylase
MVPNSRRRVLIVLALAILLTSTMAWPLQAAVFQSPPPVCTGTFYTVQPGDGLFRLAIRFGTSVQAIMNCNAITNPNLIFVGQRLLIPGAGTTPPPAPPPPGTGFVYIVRAGDTLFSIASRYGTTVSAIVAANNLRNANLIFIGQRLWIPGAGTAPPPPSGRTYRVVAGDTVSGIAARFGVSQWVIISLNGLRFPYIIYVGQILRIP